MQGPWVAIVFWLFAAITVVAGVWRQVAIRRDIQMTIRLAIEKGQSLDPALLEKMMQPSPPGSVRSLAPGAILIAMGLGFPCMGYFISLGGDSKPLYPLTGVGVLLLLMGVALVLAWRLQHQSATDGGSGR